MIAKVNYSRNLLFSFFKKRRNQMCTFIVVQKRELTNRLSATWKGRKKKKKTEDRRRKSENKIRQIVNRNPSIPNYP